jgi:hypothetical protein
MECIHCKSANIQSRGLTKSGKKQFFCKDCKKWFRVAKDEVKQEINNTFEEMCIVDRTKKIFVVTSAQSRTPINENFFAALKHYIKFRDAQLIVIPVLYNNPNAFIAPEEEVFDRRLKDYLSSQNIQLAKKLKVLGSLKINACAESPLSGLDSITKGDSVILGHNQLAMKTLAVQQDDLPVVLTTTGTISNKNYSESKLGFKASFNHSMSACVVELDGDIFHLRHLNFDGKGFYDFEYYYDKDGFTLHEGIEALITGDEHATFADPEVKSATYTAPKSIVNVLEPKVIVRHDLLDCYSISHHHKNNSFTQYAKYVSGTNKIEDELMKTIEYVAETTPFGVKNIIVSSNHNDHLTRWLNEVEIKLEPWNALLFHRLMYEMLLKTSMKNSSADYPNPFELYSLPIFHKKNINIEFLHRTTSYKIHGIELASHGDKGRNGARGSRRQFSDLPAKSVIGHSHSPGIEKGCYQTGTSSYLQMEYNQGPSSWVHAHVIIYPNGKRQLISIIKGKWRLQK